MRGGGCRCLVAVAPGRCPRRERGGCARRTGKVEDVGRAGVIILVIPQIIRGGPHNRCLTGKIKSPSEMVTGVIIIREDSGLFGPHAGELLKQLSGACDKAIRSPVHGSNECCCTRNADSVCEGDVLRAVASAAI